jgi:hypothetical protein
MDMIAKFINRVFDFLTAWGELIYEYRQLPGRHYY